MARRRGGAAPPRLIPRRLAIAALGWAAAALAAVGGLTTLVRVHRPSATLSVAVAQTAMESPPQEGLVEPAALSEPVPATTPAPTTTTTTLTAPPPPRKTVRRPARAAPARRPTPYGGAFAPATAPSKYPVYRDNWDWWGPRIRGCESWGSPSAAANYDAENPTSGASGAYQFLDSTWAGSYGVPKARMATPAQQEQAALDLFRAQGTRPWNASYLCWKGETTTPTTNS